MSTFDLSLSLQNDNVIPVPNRNVTPSLKAILFWNTMENEYRNIMSRVKEWGC